MTPEIALVFCLIALAGALMATNRVRYDFVAILVVITLPLSGILSVSEAVAGFGNTVVVLVGALFAIGEMLERTGVAHAVGRTILTRGQGRPAATLVLLILSAALLGSVMSSTAVVAIFIPIVLRIAQVTGLPKRALLLPMSYGALVSGMLTLIGTPANLVISDELDARGFEPLGFFSMLPMGLIVLAAVIAGFLWRMRGQAVSDDSEAAAGDGLRSAAEIWLTFKAGDDVHVFEVRHSGILAPPDEVRVLARRRRGPGREARNALFSEGMEMQEGDLLLVRGPRDALSAAGQGEALHPATGPWSDPARWLDTIGVADVLVHPEASAIGKDLAVLDFRAHRGLEVLGINRAGEAQDPSETTLRAGDRLLVAGDWARIDDLKRARREFVVLDEPRERQLRPPTRDRAPVALMILGAMVLASVFGIVPITLAVLIAALAAVLSGTVPATQAYRCVKWHTLVLIAGMLPLATALEKTGGTAYLVNLLIEGPDSTEPRLVLAGLFALTTGLSLVLSNTATAVLIAPISVQIAGVLGLAPEPFALAVLLGASAGFASPVSSPVVTLVVAPGGYSFGDFLRAGLPLTLVTGVVAVFVTPLIFPF